MKKALDDHFRHRVNLSEQITATNVKLMVGDISDILEFYNYTSINTSGTEVLLQCSLINLFLSYVRNTLLVEILINTVDFIKTLFTSNSVSRYD